MIDTSKVIHAPVGGGRYTVTAPIIKEDYGLYLKIEGLELPETYQVDFSNQEHNGTSVTMIGNSDGVLIPSQFIKSGKDVFAFLYHVGEDYGRTVYKFRIPNKLRPDRTDEAPTPEEQSVIDQAIAALNNAVEQTAQDVIDADASAQSASESAEQAQESARTAGLYSDTAQTYANSAEISANSASASATASAQSAQSASQSAQTASEKADAITGLTANAQTLPSGSSATASYSNGTLTLGIPRGADGRDGTDGTDGDDGISPTVTITPITGGHRITITDADGSHSADVMDGTGNVDDVQVNGRSVLSDGVANIPIADANNSGVVIVNSNYGIDRNDNGRLMVNASTADQTKAGTNNYRPIVPSNQHSATFYGLAKAAGDTTQSQSSNAVGEYTEGAKSAISEMLGGSVSVSGTTPTIVAKAGIRYVCGEVATLDFTPSQTGICDVVFTSGSAPTVVTLPSTVKFPDGAFTAEADTTYEINILDGVYGAVMAWT